MKILISPAKSLDLNSDFGNFECSIPKFLNKTSEINEVLKEKSVSELKNIQGISEKLADLNWNRNNEFNKEHSAEKTHVLQSLLLMVMFTTVLTLKLLTLKILTSCKNH